MVQATRFMRALSIQRNSFTTHRPGTKASLTVVQLFALCMPSESPKAFVPPTLPVASLLTIPGSVLHLLRTNFRGIKPPTSRQLSVRCHWQKFELLRGTSPASLSTKSQCRRSSQCSFGGFMTLVEVRAISTGSGVTCRGP